LWRLFFETIHLVSKNIVKSDIVQIYFYKKLMDYPNML